MLENLKNPLTKGKSHDTVRAINFYTSMQKKYLISIVVVLVLVAGGILLWQKRTVQNVVQNEPKEEVKIIENTDTNKVDTSDWKTYQNEEYGFEMKYPAWFANFESGEIFEGTTLKNSSFKINSGGHFEYNVWENMNNVPASELIDQKYMEYSGGWSGSFEEIVTSEGSYFRGAREDGACLIEIDMFSDARKFHVLRIEMCNVEGRDEKLNVFHNMLSTVRF